MAVLLRTVGIPSRIITGFRGAQFNQLNSTYIVRASDAHSWVEAYIPGAGWIAFDPTPAGDAPAARPSGAAPSSTSTRRVSSGASGSSTTMPPTSRLSPLASVRKTRHGISDFRRWAARRYRRMLQCARRVHQAATHDPKRLLRPALILLALLLLLSPCPLPRFTFAASGEPLPHALRRARPQPSSISA